MKTKDELPVCPVATAVSLVGGKWKLLIIRNLRVRPWRFNELQRDLEILYGKTITYGEIAKNLSATRGLSSISAQAVGGAVGHNSISIIIPCHRVVGVDGRLKGYAGGIERKRYLLDLEQNSCNANHVQV